MEKINLNTNMEEFLLLNMRYNPDRLRDLLVKMCRGLKIEITEANLYSMAANVERDMEHIMREGRSPGLHSRVLRSGSLSRHAQFIHPGRACRRAQTAHE